MKRHGNVLKPTTLVGALLLLGVVVLLFNGSALGVGRRVDPCPVCKDCKCPKYKESRKEELPVSEHVHTSLPRLVKTQGKGLTQLERLYNEEEQNFLAYNADAAKAQQIREKHGVLKIAGFTRLWPPPIHAKGGMQYHAQHLYSRLASLGHTVHVFTTGNPGNPVTHYFKVDLKTLKVEKSSSGNSNLVVHQCPSKRSGSYSVTWYKSTLEKYHEVGESIGGWDAAHSESWAGVANAQQLGVPLVVTWHGSMMDWFRNEMNLIIQNFRLKHNAPSKSNVDRLKGLGESVAYETYALQSVPHHITISDSARDDLVGVDLIPTDRVHLVYNGVNEENFKPDAEARPAFLSKHKLSDSDFVVGCGGRLAPEKGHGQLARAMASVLEEHPGIVLMVAGSGAEGKKYEKLKDKGLRVHMIGMLSQVELAEFYNAIDVFIDPFWQHHGLNTVMIEASLTATPIIATRLASAKTTIPNDAFGLTFNLGLKEDLIAAITYLKDNPAESKQIGINLRKRALKLFTSTVMAQKYEKVLYDAVLHPLSPAHQLDGEVVCKDTYPAMCFRLPKKDE